MEMKEFWRLRAAGAGAAVVAIATLGAACAPASATSDEPEVQRVEIEVTAQGYAPAAVQLVAGTPAELVFTRTTGSGCVARVHSPELGIELTELPQGEPVTIELDALEPGSYEYRCGMNMVRGTVIVTAPGAGQNAQPAGR
jgi:plastocyanin domain-containing protein